MLENNQENKLILLKDLGMRFLNKTSNRKMRYGLYRCYCSKEFETQTQSVKSGNTKSCGCNKGSKKHNLRHHRLYKTWNNMIRRCTNHKAENYKNYGDRGISVSNEWLDINNFINDMYPSYQEGLSIDRIDVNGNYEKSNCRWTNKTVQARNTRLLQSNNKSGYRGVSWNKINKKWVSQIKIDKKVIYLGYFIDKLEAAKAYDKYIIDNNFEHTRNFNS